MTTALQQCLRIVLRREEQCLRSQSAQTVWRRRISTFHSKRVGALPDLLLPAFSPSRPFIRSSAHHVSSKTSAKSRLLETPQLRHFSGSPSSRAVVVTTKSRQDDDGNDMIVDITPRAANRLREIMTKDSNPDLALRVTVQSGGCHGFQYLMSLINSSKDVSPEEDIVFEADDGSGAKVVMDEPSLELLKGSKVDYTMELIGSQFKIVGNPAATSSCGCGTSFDIKP
ncbi:MAG: hypothetical protein MMC33_001374 [Icmadophila ericetorum]|nr:hypothetical protein [Icmadophila ericetorum]